MSYRATLGRPLERCRMSAGAMLERVLELCFGKKSGKGKDKGKGKGKDPPGQPPPGPVDPPPPKKQTALEIPTDLAQDS
eukprot:1388963-Alexandrium_andersonii.AAC.1